MPADIDACVQALEGKAGIDNPHALCNWMKSQGVKLPAERTDPLPVEAEVFLHCAIQWGRRHLSLEQCVQEMTAKGIPNPQRFCEHLRDSHLPIPFPAEPDSRSGKVETYAASSDPGARLTTESLRKLGFRGK